MSLVKRHVGSTDPDADWLDENLTWCEAWLRQFLNLDRGRPQQYRGSHGCPKEHSRKGVDPAAV
jgi:hypothetical protein